MLLLIFLKRFIFLGCHLAVCILVNMRKDPAVAVAALIFFPIFFSPVVVFCFPCDGLPRLLRFLCLASFRWLGGKSLEDIHSGLSLLVCLGIGPVGVGLDLHIEELVFGSRDLSVIIPVNENEKVFVFGSILIPGLLVGPFLF